MREVQAVVPALPYTPPYFPGEMLSSWLRRVAAEYAVDLSRLAQHIGLSVSRAAQIDHELTADDLRRAAIALCLEPRVIETMVHSARVQILRPTASLLQVCLSCRAEHRSVTRLPVAIRAWFEFWQIECRTCGLPFAPPGGPRLDRINPSREEPIWFESLRKAALAGAGRLADFARRPFATGWSPLAVLRLLSMGFDTTQFAHTSGRASKVAESFSPRRLVELFVPGLAARWRANLLPEPWTKTQPVRLVTARTILLAGMTAAIENRVAALRLLQSATPYVTHRDFCALLSTLTHPRPPESARQESYN